MSNPDFADLTPVLAQSYFVRYRNALTVRADLSPLFVDYYLHLMDKGLKYESAHDERLKDALAALILHLITRPWKETHAWTLNFQEPLLNLFVTGSSMTESVTGRIFTEGVKEDKSGLFYAQLTPQNGESRQSTTTLSGFDILSAVESFYQQSEQRRARIFRLPEEEFVMVSAQPDCDMEWLESLDEDGVQKMDDAEELALLEERRYFFSCGCSLARIFPAIAPLARHGLDELFSG